MSRDKPKISLRASKETAPRRQGQLALALQEALTATVRLRAGRQAATDAQPFRARIKQTLGAAERDARQVGYAGEDVRLAIYAVVVFLDESVLNSSLAMFSDWPRQPLQEELFGGHMGGEVFFQNLHQLLARQDSGDLADLLEVYQLCLLLGYQGRYSVMDKGELQGLMAATAEKIRRIRGRGGDLSPSWAPPAGEVTRTARDPWARRVGYGAAVAFALAWLLFAAFQFGLLSGVTDLQALMRQLVR